MFITNQKAEFSVAFVHALATVGGYTVSFQRVDSDSVDVEICGGKKHGNKRKAPRLDVQLKCTETDDGTGPSLSYALPMKNYDDLRIVDLHIPHILVVLCVPKSLDEWIRETVTETALRRTAYWHSLKGAPAVSNTDTRTISIPRSQRFDVPSLKSIMERIGEGDWP